MNPVWQGIATFILRNRIPFLIFLGLVTTFMWYNRGLDLAQNITNMILTDDPALDDYEEFKKLFGDDANVMVASIDGDLRDYELFTGLYDLSRDLKTIHGVEGAFGLTQLYDVQRDDSLRQFQLVPVVQRRPESQAEVDSVYNRLLNLPFYQGLLMSDSTSSTLLAVSLNAEIMNTEEKVPLVTAVEDYINAFGEKHNAEIHIAGLPILRANGHRTVKKEIFLFLILALAVTAIVLLVFFRSLYMVIFPLMVVGSVIVFSLGIIGLFGYKLTLITGIIPALVTVISIPNSVYLITKYHIEYRRTRNKMKSLVLVIEKIGIVTVMTNATTAIGLGVLAFTDIGPLHEFGVVAGLSVVAAFFISLLLIPIVFSFLPPPSDRQTKHLDRRSLGFVIKGLDKMVHNRRPVIYTVALVLVGLSVWGLLKVQPVAYVADDIPQDSKVMRDLRYIEGRYGGALPFEIIVDTKKKRGALRQRSLQKIAELQDSLATYDEISRSLSVADFARFFRQSFMGGDPAQYDLPSRSEYNFIAEYAQGFQLNGNLAISKSLVDDELQITRVSASVKDIGSLEMDRLVSEVQADVDSIFDPERYNVTITGTTQIFIKSNDALIDNLLKSLLMAFVIIALIMGALFRSGRIVIISLIPNLLPLLMVAGIMGFFHIALKPSTALVFGVAFGIAVDDSIHYLARYRLARKVGDTIAQAVSNSFKDTGVSMIYTSLILFFGFVCFTASEFGGTQALGLLTSMTLGIAMFSNLVLLPSLLLTFDKEENQARLHRRKRRRMRRHEMKDGNPSEQPSS